MFLQSILTWLLVQCAAWRLEVARLLPRKIEHSRPSLLLSWKRSQPCRVFKHVSHTFVFLSNLFGHFSGAGVFEAVRAFVCSRYLLIDTWSMDSMKKILCSGFQTPSIREYQWQREGFSQKNTWGKISSRKFWVIRRKRHIFLIVALCSSHLLGKHSKRRPLRANIWADSNKGGWKFQGKKLECSHQSKPGEWLGHCLCPFLCSKSTQVVDTSMYFRKGPCA